MARFLQLIPMCMTFLMGGCQSATPEKGSDAISAITRYNEEGRYDDAIRVGQDWIKKHPDDSHVSMFYEQIAITLLMKASRNTANKEELAEQAVGFFDKFLAIRQKADLDTNLYSAGRGFEAAGDVVTKNKCLYYGRAIKAFNEEFGAIRGETYTAYGRTIPLASLREENRQSLERVQKKYDNSGCK